jgi:hypothetical protein
MVWAGICATGKTKLVFIDRGGIKINAGYSEIVNKVVRAFGKRHFGRNWWTLQQDMAPAHGAKTTQALCKKLLRRHWGKDMWPPRSPDLNPMDYSIWSLLKQRLGRRRFKSINELKAALKRAWKTITIEELQRIVGQFRRRLEACIAVEGSNFEHLL